MGDYTTQLYEFYNKPLYKALPINQPVYLYIAIMSLPPHVQDIAGTVPQRWVWELR